MGGLLPLKEAPQNDGAHSLRIVKKETIRGGGQRKKENSASKGRKIGTRRPGKEIKEPSYQLERSSAKKKKGLSR